jgi:hypothetical protein
MLSLYFIAMMVKKGSIFPNNFAMNTGAALRLRNFGSQQMPSRIRLDWRQTSRRPLDLN